MSRKRSLLFYIRFETGKVTSFPGSGYDIDKTIREIFNLRLNIHDLLEETKTDNLRNNNKHCKDYSLDYKFYDWDLGTLKPDLRISQIPKPGIIIAVHKNRDMIYAAQIKQIVKNTSDTQQRDIFKSFTEGPEGKFEPFCYDVFLSYAEEDKELSNELYELFTNSGLKCFMDKKSLSIGTIWENDIRKALVNSLSEVILLTPESIKSLWVMCEVGACWVLEKRIFPALLNVKLEDLPEPIRKYQCIQIKTIENRNKLKDDIIQYCGV